MITICAWCKTPLSAPADKGTDESVTHGICPKCAAKLRAGLPVTLDSFVEQFDSELWVVDEGGNVLAANRKAIGRTGRTKEEVRGMPEGLIFECQHAYLPEGCGKTKHCSGCLLRRTIDRCAHRGENQSRCTVTMTQRTAEGARPSEVQIAVERVGDKVLLRVDSLQPSLSAS